ncbi:MAG: hypothetical protein IT257_12055 [Chitinophagaceae bacterium]|nr:hypothetical protein [Chitinophagaceae bacterium]
MNIVTFDIDDQCALNQFEELAYMLYNHEKKHYASQVNQINLALFVKGFLLLDQEKAQARCVLYNPDLQYEKKPLIFFGNFEAANVSSGTQLLQSVIAYYRQHYPAYQLTGPINGHTWNDYRIAVNHHPQLFPFDICSGSFYHDLVLKCGFRILHQYYTNLQTNIRLQKTFESADFKVTFFSKKQFEEKLPQIYQLTMEAFEQAILLSPLSEEQFVTKQMQLLSMLEMDLLPFVLDQQNRIAAFALCYIGFEQDTLVVKTIARKKGRRYAGIGRLLSTEIIRIATDRRIAKIYHAFMHENNLSTKLSKSMYGERIKTYALYAFNDQF